MAFMQIVLDEPLPEYLKYPFFMGNKNWQLWQVFLPAHYAPYDVKIPGLVIRLHCTQQRGGIGDKSFPCRYLSMYLVI
jgi:hypothetical protein